MFITYDKRAFQIRADNGLILTIKQVPEEISMATMSNGQVTVVTRSGRTYIYRQIGNSPEFTFFRKY